MLTEIPFCVTVGSGLRPKNVMVAFSEGIHQAGQPDDQEVGPAETPAVGGMPKLMHTNLIAKDVLFAFALHPTTGPKVDEGAQRHTHAILVVLPCRESDATKRIHLVDLARKRPHNGIEPSHQGLWQFPGKPQKQLAEATHGRPLVIGQEEASGDLCGKAESLWQGCHYRL